MNKCDIVRETVNRIYKASSFRDTVNHKRRYGYIEEVLTQAEARRILRAAFNEMNSTASQHKQLILRSFAAYHEPICVIKGSLYRIGYRIDNIPCVVFNVKVGNRTRTENQYMGFYKVDPEVPLTLIKRLHQLSLTNFLEASYEKGQ